ncbi:MAG: LysR family transcriptional regulator [Clostridia bacterium]|nr:LysR family transcriptional regulator [Clostridia bacterium]
MNDKQLISFITVADKGSFYKAAQVLYTSPQTLIQQMNQLEQEVDAKLFERNNKGVTLTAAGEEFYKGAQGILRLTNETIEKSRSADDVRSEVIRVGLSPLKTMIMPAACLEFSIRHPEVHLQIVQIAASDWVSLLCDEKVDVIEGDVSKDQSTLQIEMTKLVRDQRVCILSPAHPLAGKEKISLCDLADYQVCVHNLSWLQELKTEIREKTSAVKLIEKPCTVANVFDTCLNGGVFLAPYYFAITFDPLIVRPLDVDLEWDFGIAYRKQHSPAVDKFIAVAKEVFKA